MVSPVLLLQAEALVVEEVVQLVVAAVVDTVDCNLIAGSMSEDLAVDKATDAHQDACQFVYTRFGKSPFALDRQQGIWRV